MKAALLSDRGVIKVGGEAARDFLNGLVTTDVGLIEPGLGLIGADLVDAAAYEAHRIACGAPRGGIDFMYGDAFPHETNMDRLHGVDFDKGCYVGQEVVSRMQHRGTARTRTVRLILEDLAPEAGIAIVAGDRPVGTMGSSAKGIGLGLLR